MKNIVVNLTEDEYRAVKYVSNTLDMSMEEFFKRSGLKEMEVIIYEEFYSLIKKGMDTKLNSEFNDYKDMLNEILRYREEQNKD